MFNSSTNYKTSTLEASVSSIEGLMEAHAEMVTGLEALQLIIKDHNTPLSEQTLEELEHIYAVAHRMLSQELANIKHIQYMQEARKKAEEIFGEMKQEHQARKSNKPTQATA